MLMGRGGGAGEFFDAGKAGFGFYSIVDIKFQGQCMEVTQSDLEGSYALVLCQFMPWRMLLDAAAMHWFGRVDSVKNQILGRHVHMCKP